MIIGYNELITSVELGLIYGTVALGIVLSLRTINFSDLTCDGSFVLGAALSCTGIQLGYNPWICIAAAGIGGLFAGATTGILHVYGHISDILSGILVSFMLYSINLRVMFNRSNISIFDYETMFSTMERWAPLVIITCSIIFFMSLLFITDLGLALRSIGYNIKLAHNNGINVGRIKIIGLALSNGLIALGGGLFGQYQEFVDIGSGFGTLIIGLASIMIGEIFFKNLSRMTSYIIACFLGSITYRLIISIALHNELFDLAAQDFNLITGLITIGIIQFSRSRS